MTNWDLLYALYRVFFDFCISHKIYKKTIKDAKFIVTTLGDPVAIGERFGMFFHAVANAHPETAESAWHECYMIITAPPETEVTT